MQYDRKYARTVVAEMETRHAVSNAYRELGARDLNHGSTGNVSCRLGDRIFITPTGTRFDSVTPESIVIMDAHGTTQGNGVPSCEWAMHLEIYSRKPEAVAIVHTHSDACVALSSLRRPIPAFHYMVASFGGTDIPCAPYAPFGTRELAFAAAVALRDRAACLLANHGMICHSRTLPEAVTSAIALETLARQYLMALRAGTPIVLTDDEIAAVRQRLELYGHNQLSGAPWPESRENQASCQDLPANLTL